MWKSTIVDNQFPQTLTSTIVGSQRPRMWTTLGVHDCGQTMITYLDTTFQCLPFLPITPEMIDLYINKKYKQFTHWDRFERYLQLWEQIEWNWNKF